ncbi:hypothetical protein [Spiroplasma platyhelix]|uniref:Lipoprotein n=1 Tax=Spiroplasma platyhelix PALS-1 TaxID=1276218 RepID=A0A846UE99_9MOLU|nr:hypothetical protein [Spiroplasma platyhelix]MBE4704439.1 hypothetical protein [Spiroplasma platyhelix PALS-1]NKE38808.1 hypothetical protein [Spiroplasma platyhelix PALS-1]UJB29021.1 hypothetical protein SPLAT_v1c02570 [Spiroplasma platyhelix PALS-1]
MKRQINFKKMLSLIGTSIVAVPAVLSVVACGNIQVAENGEKPKEPKDWTQEKNLDQQVVDAINGVDSYQLNVLFNSKLDNLKSQITTNFIKNQLIGEDNKSFKDNLFTLNNIFNKQNQELTDKDLAGTGIINAKINYDYGSITNQSTNIIIVVTVSDQQIVEDISTRKYSKTVILNSDVIALKASIDCNFIKNQLGENIQSTFDEEKFNFTNILNDKGTNLSNSDLNVSRTISTKIIYDYGKISNQSVNLTINVGISDQQVVDAINESTYTKDVKFNSEINSLKSTIDTNFIKSQLTEDINKTFKDDLFTLNRIIDSRGTDLLDSDLNISRTINAKIIYNYGKFNNQSTSLIITVGASDQQVVDAINKELYFKNINLNGKVNDVKTQINANFIKNQLDKSTQSIFADDKFTLFNVLLNSKSTDLLDSDIVNSGTIVAKIVYNYGSITNQSTNLIISVTVSDQQIVDAINESSYSTNVELNSKVSDLKTIITSNFIKDKLPEEIADVFKDSSFTLNKITNDKNMELSYNDFKVPGRINAEINYNYGKFRNQSTNLIIDIKENRASLTDVFKDFNFKDLRDVEGFLDSNDLKNITTQIEKYLGKSLDEAGLILENQKATSILLKAKSDAKDYQGEVTLTWNLKLFEALGQPLLSSTDESVRKGIKLYIYLDHQDNQVKAFDLPGYKDALTVVGYANSLTNPRTHNFSFSNNKGVNKSFNIYSRDLSSVLPSRFGSFDFTNGIQVTLNPTTAPYYKGVFNKNSNRWVTSSKRTYFIDHLGNVN